MNEQDTHADIIAEMRFHGQQNIDAEKDKPECGILTVEGRIALNYADRLEAAHKREVQNALDAGGLVEASRHKRECGNVAKLREALNLCVDEMCARCRDLAKARGNPAPCLNGCEPVRKAKAALAEPIKNCEVGTAEEQEKRFHDFCRARHLPRMEESRYCAYKCPLEGDTCCELQWAQMPYEEGGAK